MTTSCRESNEQNEKWSGCGMKLLDGRDFGKWSQPPKAEKHIPRQIFLLFFFFSLLNLYCLLAKDNSLV